MPSRTAVDAPPVPEDGVAAMIKVANHTVEATMAMLGSDFPDDSPVLGNKFASTIKAVMPILEGAKAAVTGLGIPGVEGVVNGVYFLAQKTLVCGTGDVNKFC
jgi:hypothetical protein